MRSRFYLAATTSLVAAAGLLLALAAPASADLTTGLALYCDMENTTSINTDKVVPDEYGNPDKDGTIGGTNILQVNDAGRGNVIRFNTRHLDNNVNFGDYFDPGVTSFTVAMWVKRYETSNNNFYEYVVSKGNGASTIEAWSIFFNQADNSLRMRANHDDGTGTTRPYVYTETGIAAGEWHHIAMVIDQEAGLFQGYLDGVGSGADGQNGIWTTSTSYTVTIPTDGSADFNTTIPLNLGRVNNGSVWRYPFRGDIDDFAIWNRALTTAEIQTLYTATANGTRIVDVPEPGALTLVLAAMVALAGTIRRRG